MNFLNWLRPGLNIKRWLVIAFIGIFLISYGLAIFISSGINMNMRTFVGFSLITVGLVLIIVSVIFMSRTFFKAINESGLHKQINSHVLNSILIERKQLERGPKIVAIGGGTGLSTMLRGLKAFTSNLTAVVTVTDDGGGSGILREDLGMLPPGDIRNCILALARTEPILEKLMQYRFKEGMLKGQNFGNLLLAAMTGISGSFEKAVKLVSDVLAVTGKVLPVTVDDIRLYAELEDGSFVFGEHNIVNECKTRSLRIKKIFLEPSYAQPLPEVIERIKEADAIILGPGSLYTSIIPNLLVNGICNAIRESSGLKIYVCNIMTQRGETDNYTAYDHIKAIENHGGTGCIEYCIVNKGKIKNSLMQKYNIDGAEKVYVDEYTILKNGIKVIGADLVKIENGFIRHNSLKLAEIILKLINEGPVLKERRGGIKYFSFRDKMKKISSIG